MSEEKNPPPAYESEKDNGSLEKSSAPQEYVVQTDGRYHFDVHDLDQVQRKLKQRHVQMIAVSSLLPLLLLSPHPSIPPTPIPILKC